MLLTELALKLYKKRQKDPNYKPTMKIGETLRIRLPKKGKKK
jgi:hypothetical protein